MKKKLGLRKTGKASACPGAELGTIPVTAGPGRREPAPSEKGLFIRELPREWQVFGPVDADFRLNADQLAAVPAFIESAGERLYPRPIAGGRELNLAPIIGGVRDDKGAVLYMPFRLAKAQGIRFGFGADWWFEAFLDGQWLCGNTPDGNGSSPPTTEDFVAEERLDAGEHLLVIRFVSGSSAATLCVEARPAQWSSADTVLVGDTRVAIEVPARRWTLANRAMALELRLVPDGLVLHRLENRLAPSPADYIAGPPAHHDPRQRTAVLLPGMGPWQCVAEKVVETVDGGNAVARLDLTLARRDGTGFGLEITIHVQMYPDTPVCRLWSEMTNTAAHPRLVKAVPFASALFPGQEVRLHWLRGGHGRPEQGRLETEPVGPGFQRVIEASATRQAVPVAIFQRSGGAGDGLLVELEFLGDWQCRIGREGAGPVQLAYALQQPADIAIAPGETVRMPVMTLAMFRDDLDDLGVRLYDWQYRYLWDYTNPEYFARPRLGTWWFFCSRNLQETFTVRLAGMGMPMDQYSEVGYEILWDDAGWSVYSGPGLPPDNYGSISLATQDGPDFSRTQRYVRKKGMKWLLWFCGTPSAGLLATKVGAWGDFEWRTDGVPVVDGVKWLHGLYEDNQLRDTIREFLGKHPASSFHTCSGGGCYCHQFDIYRYATFNYLSDLGRGPYVNYYFSILEPPDKGGDILQPLASVRGRHENGAYDLSPAERAARLKRPGPPALEDLRYIPETARHNLTGLPMPGCFSDPADNECVRQDLELYRFLLHEGVAGRWSYMFHPRVEGDAEYFFLQRSDRTRRKGCIILKCQRKGRITLYPKGLLPGDEYVVTFAVTPGRAVRTGADLMANGITLENYPARELVFLNLEHRPGSGLDTTPPQAPGLLLARRENNLGHSGNGLYWSPGQDDTWLSYHEVARDDRVIARVTVGNYWFDHSMGWESAGSYAVRAVDGDGNRSAWTTATALPGEPDAYEALGGHFPEDGRDGWTAEFTTGDGRFRPMTWVAPERNPAADLGGTPNQRGGADGYREGGGGQVGRGWMRASTSAAVARTWTVSRDGDVRITGRLVKEWYHRELGAPLHARILLNSDQVWPRRGTATIGHGVMKAVQHDLPLKVRKGDILRFVLERGSEPENDLLVWMPVIRYADAPPAGKGRRVVRTGKTGADFTEAIPVPPGVYDVRLTFVEKEFAHQGERPIHVDINGRRILTDFDILRAGGGRARAEVAFPYVLPGADGTVRLRFQGGLRHDGKRAKATVARMELLPAFRPTVRITCGSKEPFIDWNGDVWDADPVSTGKAIKSASPVSQAAPTVFDQPLYQTARSGRRLTYRFALPPGLYAVHLKFAELWLDPAEARPMHIAINGVVVREAFDAAKAAGQSGMAADVRFEGIAPDSDGCITVSVTAAGKHAAVLQALEIN